jgi:hypothetical protein
VLYTPARHERLAGEPFGEAAALAAIRRIAARTEHDLDHGVWPLDAGEERTSLYWGAPGVVWALTELADLGLVAPTTAEVPGVDPADEEVPEGLWWSEAGALAVAERRSPDSARRNRLAELARRSLTLPSLEPMEGHPGYMLLAAQLHAKTGEERWAEIWSAGAERLFAEWRYHDDLDAWLWAQRLGGADVPYLGAAHGLVANAHVLRRGGGLLPHDRLHEAERRTVETLTRLAVVEDGRANWPPAAGDPLENRGRIRVQWCHGAVGVLTAMHDAAPADPAWGRLLLAAGELVWDAGPIRDDPGLCHGTAGNAFALLALARRTGDERWLERARAFAQHAAAQVEQRFARLGRGSHSLFTGDEGVAICLASCLTGDERLPIADRLV